VNSEEDEYRRQAANAERQTRSAKNELDRTVWLRVDPCELPPFRADNASWCARLSFGQILLTPNRGRSFSVAAFAEPRSMLMARKRAAQAFPRGRSRPKAEGVTAQPSPTIEQVLNGLTPAARSRTKKPRTMPGLKLLEIWRRSVTSYNRALTKIEVIVKPRRNQIHILPDPIGYLQRACRPKTSNYPGREQPDVPVTHEKMVIFDPD
jgi:hypothetical protein